MGEEPKTEPLPRILKSDALTKAKSQVKKRIQIGFDLPEEVSRRTLTIGILVMAISTAIATIGIATLIAAFAIGDGPRGDTGSAGPAGITGAIGKKGPEGEAGVSGPAGAAGSPYVCSNDIDGPGSNFPFCP